MVAFALSSVLDPATLYAQGLIDLPAAGAVVKLSEPFQPAILKGLKVDPANPLKFDFIVDKGDSRLEAAALENEGQKLIKYFLTALTVPENELWVNLSPYEGNRIIPDKFGLTEMGRDLLAEDYLLKQLTASLMDPDAGLGREFWQRVYERAQKEFGTTDIPVDTFNKVWIMPDTAKIFEKGNSVYLVESRMKVLLEQDYVALQNNKIEQVPSEDNDKYKVSKFASDIVREVIIPELTREVNEGENFAKLRQVHNSLVLAAWYRQKVKDGILGTSYVGQNKIAGSESGDPAAKDKIYAQYVEAFEKGVYNYIKEDYDTYSQQMIPRKYFSGGYAGEKIDFAMATEDDLKLLAAGGQDAVAGLTAERGINTGALAVAPGRFMDFRTNLKPNAPEGADSAMTTVGQIAQLASQSPTGALLRRISESVDRETLPPETAQLIFMLRNSLSWREGMQNEVQQVYARLIQRVLKGRPVLDPLRFPEIKRGITGAVSDLDLTGSENKVVLVGGDEEFFGVAQVDRVIYIENAFLKRMLALDDPEERIRAAFARAFTATPDEGVLQYWKKAKERLGPEAALEKFGLNTREDPERLIRQFSALFYAVPDDPNYLALRELFEKEGITFPEIQEGSQSERLLYEVFKFSRWAIAENFMNMVLGERREDVQPLIGYAGSPTTSAHMLALRMVNVLCKAAKGDFNLTGDDYRKLILSYNKLLRLVMNKQIAAEAGDDYIIPDEFEDLNGEERTDQIVYKEEFRLRRDYIFGTDHFRAFLKRMFSDITDRNIKDFWYYYRKPGAIYIMKALLENKDFYRLTADDVLVLNKLVEGLQSKSFALLLETKATHYVALKERNQVDAQVAAFKEWMAEHGIARLPNLDVVSKHWLNNLNLFGDQEWKIGLAVLPREDVAPDPIREAMITGTLSVDGKVIGKPMRVRFIPMPEATNKVSSSAGRNVLLELLLFGKISEEDAPGFFSIPTLGWSYVLTNEKFRTSLLDNLKVPFSAEVVARKGGRKALQELRTKMPPGSTISIVPILRMVNGIEEVDSFALQIHRDQIIYEFLDVDFREGQAEELIKTIEESTQFRIPAGPSPVTRLNALMQNRRFESRLIEMSNQGKLSSAVSAIIHPEQGAMGFRKVRDILVIDYQAPEVQRVAQIQVRSSYQQVAPGIFRFVNVLMGDIKRLSPEELQVLKSYNSIDSAMEQPDDQQSQIKGGIDFGLNNIYMDIQSDGDNVQFNFDPATLQNGNFDGLVPVILNVTPINDLPMFLGAKEPDQQLAGAGV
jgi:hypothetical protein